MYESIDDEKTCQFYKSNGDLLEEYDSSVKGYRSDQYWVDPTIPKGSTQYEFTSKYNLSTGYWSNTKYYANEVDHVIFDVKITLEPSKETVYKKNASGWGKDSEKTFNSAEIAEKTKELESVKFRMDHQDVLDAYNKCPNHSGLDFTIMAFSALVEFDLNKDEREFAKCEVFGYPVCYNCLKSKKDEKNFKLFYCSQCMKLLCKDCLYQHNYI